MLGLGTIVLALFRDALLFGRVFYVRDISGQWQGLAEAFRACVQAGEAPLWNPWMAFGQALWADPIHQAAYPPTWLLAVLPLPTYYALFLAAHVLMSGIGQWLLARRLGLTPLAAWTAGALWALSGPLLSMGSMWAPLATTSWIPWTLLAAEWALEGGPRRGLAWGAALAATLVAGSAETAVVCALFTGARAVLRLRAPGAERRRVLAVAAVAAAFAVALPAAQWMCTLDYVRHANRWTLGAEQARWAAHPLALSQALFPIPWGELPITSAVRAAWFESRDPFLVSLYLGLASSVLVLSALLGPRRRGRGALALLAILALLYALGAATPFHALVDAVVRPLRLVRYPVRYLTFTALGWSLLAGMGLDAWTELDRRRQRLALAGASLALLAGVTLAITATWAAPPWPSLLMPGPMAQALVPTRNRLIVSATLLLGVTGALLALARGRGAGVARPLVALLAVADLFAAHDGLNPTAPDVFYRFRPPVLDLLQTGDHQRVYIYRYLSPQRTREQLGREAAYVVADPDAPPWADDLAARAYPLAAGSGLWRLETAYDLDSTRMGSAWAGALRQAVNALETTPAWVRLLRIGAAAHVVTLHDPHQPELVREATLPTLFREPLQLWRVPDARPRAYAVSGVRTADGLDAIRTLIDPGFDPAAEIVIPVADGAASTDAAAAPPAASRALGPVRIADLRPGRVVLEANLSTRGYVVLVDPWDPDWRASVDGAETTLLRANVAFRAVRVGPGTHTIVMEYRPRALAPGLVGSAAALLAAVVLVIPRRRRRGTTEPPLRA